uniref:Uncharacterized protein n=1 Tax=Arundo donax TaxID=35708 RepID=A0A0A8XPX7_ARUDO
MKIELEEHRRRRAHLVGR